MIIFLLKTLGLTTDASRILREELHPHRFQLFGFVVLALIAAVIEMTGVGLVFPLLILVSTPGKLQEYQVFSKMTSLLGDTHGRILPIVLIVLIAFLMVLKNAYMILFNWLQMRMLARWKTSLSNRLMQMYIFSDFAVHLVKNSSEIIRNIALTSAFYDQFVTGGLAVIVNITVMAGLSFLLLSFLPIQAIYGMIFLTLIAFAIYSLMKRPLERIGTSQNQIYETRQSILRQSIGMVKETKIAAKEHFFLSRFLNVETKNFSEQAHYNFLSIIPPLALESAVIVSVLGLVSYIMISSAEFNTGIAILGLLAATMFRMTPVLNRTLTGLQLMNISRNSVELISKDITLLEHRIFIPQIEPDPLPFDYVVRLENIDFQYPAAKTLALKNINLVLQKNEMIGITGPSGSGKTTLAATIMGLIAPTNGRISVDGNFLDDRLKMRSWQRHIGYVAQGITLIDDTILKNVALGVDDDKIDMPAVWAALETVQMAEFVQNLPSGVDHFIGENGSWLSGGQRQRLGISRALYSNPEILVLDEATSALDVEVERAFGESLAQLRSTRTVLIIAHRLSTLQNCDRIIFMDQGEISDVAPFEQLLRRNPKFKLLVEMSKLDLHPGI